MSTFESLGIKSSFVQGLNELGILNPTKIQAEVIPVLLHQNTDLVAQAQTGTGKTAAFGLPILERITAKHKVVQALILCPTRELGQQVAKQLFKFTKFSEKIFIESVYGGEPIERQIKALDRPTHIIVATPGRLIDLVKRKAVDLSHVNTIVLDEADEMLSMGFKSQLDTILGYVSGVQNKWLFSATMPDGIRSIVNKHLSASAIRIEASKHVVNAKIEHQYVLCEDADKLFILLQFLKTQKKNRGIIFCKTKEATKLLAIQLQAKDISADAIHGDLRQIEREKVMRAFKNEKLKYLLATDIAARGIDVSDLSFVAHYQLPDKDEYYTHRSGRTARAGKDGLSIALVNNKELKNLRFFEKKLGINFRQLT